jgi:GntR family galactonate operon transcriptional repressor
VDASAEIQERTAVATRFARTKLSDHVVLHLSREIVRGHLKSGDHLASEPELATMFGISKPVVRESLRALASLGLIRVQQGKRTVVQDGSEWNVLDPLVQEAFRAEGRGPELARQLYELRLILETNSASRAAERATPAHLQELGVLAERMKAIATTTYDRDEFLVADRAFHDAVARASGNEALRQVIRNVHDFLATAWSRSTIAEDELELLAGMHARIAVAIRDGDASAARDAMAAHVERAAEKEFASHDGDRR